MLWFLVCCFNSDQNCVLIDFIILASGNWLFTVVVLLSLYFDNGVFLLIKIIIYRITVTIIKNNNNDNNNNICQY